MSKIRMNKSQNAQGMVEFALVLPILLMLILGVFAFGHLFYVYSSVVSASREAARWGAATGTAGGAHERYRDCDQIRAAAARVAPISGITQVHSPNDTTPGVQITYDSGPGTTVYGPCDTSPGPDVKLGDRIVVTVRVRYQPIVPLIPIPSFMLQANTARTIIKDMEVGIAPSAVPVVTGPYVDLQFTPIPPASVKVGDLVTIIITATAQGSTSPLTKNITLSDDAGNNFICSTVAVTQTERKGTCEFTYLTDGTYKLTVLYPGDSPYSPANKKVDLIVDSLSGVETTVTVAPVEGTSTPNKPKSFTAHVDPINESGAGTVEFKIQGTSTVLCSAPVDASGNAVCDLSLPITKLGSNIMEANFRSSKPLVYLHSKLPGTFTYVIVQYNTTTEIISYDPPESTPSTAVQFVIHVSSPNGTPTGDVTVAAGGQVSAPCPLIDGEATCTLTITKVGDIIVIATYKGTIEFKESSSSGDTTYHVKVDESSCPTIKGAMSFTDLKTLQFNLNNPAATTIQVTSVKVEWASDPISQFSTIRFASPTSFSLANCNNSGICIWDHPNGQTKGLNPPMQTISSSTPGWKSGSIADFPQGDKRMHLTFLDTLPHYEMAVTVTFSNSCPSVKVTGTP